MYSVNSWASNISNNNVTLMPRIIQPLKTPWRIDEQQGNVKEQIWERVNSEDNYTWAKGYPLIRTKDIKKKK